MTQNKKNTLNIENDIDNISESSIDSDEDINNYLKSLNKWQLKFIKNKDNLKLADDVRKITKKYKLNINELHEILENHFMNKYDNEETSAITLKNVLKKASRKKKNRNSNKKSNKKKSNK